MFMQTHPSVVLHKKCLSWMYLKGSTGCPLGPKSATWYMVHDSPQPPTKNLSLWLYVPSEVFGQCWLDSCRHCL